jgi:hypothetical protein
MFWGLAVLLALAGALRFYQLGHADTRSDEVELIEFLQAGVGPVQYFERTWQDFQTGRQMPLPRVTSSAYVRGLGLDVNRANVRAPYAALGTLGVFFLWLLGRHWGGARLGWILGFVGAVSPFAVHWSRVAHVYGFVLPLITMTAAFMVPVLLAAARGEPPQRRHVVGAVAGSVLASYSHLSAWPLTGLLWLSLALVALRRGRWTWKAVPLALVIGFAVWAAFMAPWVVRFLGAVNSKWDMLGRISNDPVYTFGAMWRMPFAISWGGGFPGALFTLGLLPAGVYFGLRSPTLRSGTRLLLAINAALLAALALMMKLSGGIYTIRYFTPMWLLPVILTALAIEGLAATWPGRGRAIACACCAALGLGMALPLWWTMNLPGHPTPYSAVNRWMDANLPRGTPVVVDRWFEPSHEMRYHAPSNVFVTFTVPNEPLDSFFRLNWRETVKQFAGRYPDAAYLELIKCYFYVPGVGHWDWPRQYFGHRVAITNEPALKLRHSLLGMTEDYYADNTNRIVCEIFYNTVDDMLDKARAEGRNLAIFYSDGWRYAKTQDYRDWRVLEGAANVEAVNLTDQPLTVSVKIRAAAMGGTKSVRLAGRYTREFQNGRLEDWNLGPTLLPPGRHNFTLDDQLWSMAHVPLLVDGLGIEPYVAPAQTNSP